MLREMFDGQRAKALVVVSEKLYRRREWIYQPILDVIGEYCDLILECKKRTKRPTFKKHIYLRRFPNRKLFGWRRVYQFEFPGAFNMYTDARLQFNETRRRL